MAHLLAVKYAAVTSTESDSRTVIPRFISSSVRPPFWAILAGVSSAPCTAYMSRRRDRKSKCCELPACSLCDAPIHCADAQPAGRSYLLTLRRYLSSLGSVTP